MKRTKNSYSIDSEDCNNYRNSLTPTTLAEYEYNGKKYVRVKANLYNKEKGAILSNGERYKNGDSIWIEVLPVKWLVDEKSNVMITEKLICSGIQFNKKRVYKTNDFEKTDIKSFMDKHLSRDLFQTRQRENKYNLDFDEVTEEDIIKSAVKNNVSVFLHGKPGCGKSDRVRQLDPDFTELNLSHLDPELLDGLAGEKNGKAVHIKPPWLEGIEEKCKNEPNKIHILFLDELTNASPMMQSKAYGIALDKKVAGRWKLPENVRVVAAGNELSDSLVANEIAEPLYDRFAHVNIETTAEDWLKWAVKPESSYEKLDYNKEDKPKQKIHPSIYAYISARGDKVLRTPYDQASPKPHADPRRWKMASDMLYASNNPNVLRAVIGEELTKDFMSFCMSPTLTVQDIINGRYTQNDLKMDVGKQLATVSGLVRVDEENMPAVRSFVKKLSPEMCSSFEKQWARGDQTRLSMLQDLKRKEQAKEKMAINKHSTQEAKGTTTNAMLAYKKLKRMYQEYLSIKKAKENGTKLK